MNEECSRAKTVLLGSASVGKTSLALRIASESFREDQDPTIAAAFFTKMIEIGNERHKVKLEIWDTAGSERFRSLSRMYYREAVIALMCFDFTAEQQQPSLDFVRAMHKEVVETTTLNHSGPCSMFLVGCKSDLLESEQARKKVMNMVRPLCAELDLEYFETSARTGQGISELLYEAGMSFVYGDFRKRRVTAARQTVYLCILGFTLDRKSSLKVLPRDVVMMILKDYVWKDRFSHIWDGVGGLVKIERKKPNQEIILDASRERQPPKWWSFLSSC